MFKNFSKIVLRNMWRYKGYTILNIFGMGIGLAAIVWGFQTYRYSFSYDNFHKDQENVYRAMTYQSGGSGVRGVYRAFLLQPMHSFGCSVLSVRGLFLRLFEDA